MQMQSSNEQKFSVSKWLKHQVLLDSSEMAALLRELACDIYNVSSIVSKEELRISNEKFLAAYTKYIVDLKEGKVPTPDRTIFSAVMTVETDAVYAKEVQPGRWMAKLKRPVVQLQNHRFFASKLDHKIHPMVMSEGSIQWGLQIAFPQIFFDGSGGSYTKTSDESQFPNFALFGKIIKWLRNHSVPTTFVWEGQKIATPIRLGKACFAWIDNHPQMKEQGIKVHAY